MRKDSILPFRAVLSSALEVESGERSEPDGTGMALVPPDPQVVDTPVRRRFSAECKLRILRLADACTEPGSTLPHALSPARVKCRSTSG
ncbi:MAG: hypothetical protein ABFD97_05795 [Syntrophobacter sp.]